MTLDDLIGIDEAAELFGRTPDALRKAAQRGRLEAVRIGPFGTWVTTRQHVAAYVASVAVRRPVRRLDGVTGQRPP